MWQMELTARRSGSVSTPHNICHTFSMQNDTQRILKDMNTELQKHEQQAPQSALAAMASRLQVSQTRLMETLKATAFKGCSNEEFTALVIVAQTYGLNPLLKELYAFPAKGGGIVPVVGVDGWLKIITNHPQFNGMEVEVSEDGREATCKIHVKGRDYPTVITEYLDECKRPTEPWKPMPRRMLRHKAIIQAGRVAFGISGIQDEDEAKDSIRNVTPERAPRRESKPVPEVKTRPIDPFNDVPVIEPVHEVNDVPVSIDPEFETMGTANKEGDLPL